MGVNSKFRGKGYGQKLFAVCCDFAIDRGYSKLVLYATPLGRPMYEKFGFHSVGDFYRLNYIPQ
jgi:predicted GNAT family N-acyltransferase